MKTRGYDHPEILDKTSAAMRKIVEGEAIFERDSVLLSRPEYPWPLIACLLHEAQKKGGRLSGLILAVPWEVVITSAAPFSAGSPN